MRIVKLKGGVGNQMFQYAFAKLLERRTGDEVKLDITACTPKMYAGAKNNNNLVHLPRILKFKISLDVATEEELKKTLFFQHRPCDNVNLYRAGIAMEGVLNPRYYFERDRRHRDIDALLRPRWRYFDGYWQSWRLIEEIWPTIQKEFVPNYVLHENTCAYMEAMDRGTPVSVGVRRGDYLNYLGHFGVFGPEYYRAAMEIIEERVKDPVYYIFSNDVAWTKENLDLRGRQVVFREDSEIIDDFEDLMIIAHCKHAIIPNSTFQWWGARLQENPDGIVIAPAKWFADDSKIDIVPPNWIKL